MRKFTNRYLEVNLTNRKINDYHIPDDWYKKYLGGRGIGSRLLLDELDGGEDPLSPENLLVFAVGPLQGTGIAGGGRHAVIAKSPKTKTLNDSYAGGFWAHELGNSGYDGIIVKGKSPNPVYVSLIDGEAEIRDADDLWGKGLMELDEELKRRHSGSRVLGIGPAGENLVKFACIMNDVSRASGRPGFGAIMGSKNLKALAVKGGKDVQYYDEDMLKEVKKNLATELMDTEGIPDFGEWGSSASVSPLSEEGILPTKNFQEGVFDEAESIDGAGENFKKILKGRDNCTGCPIRCKRRVEGKFNGRSFEADYGGPEYETLASFGSLLMNSDVNSIGLANQLCNKYGLDTISAGVTVGFAMEIGRAHV